MLPPRDRLRVSHEKALRPRAGALERVFQFRRHRQKNPELRELAPSKLAPVRKTDAHRHLAPLDMVESKAAQHVGVERILAFGLRFGERLDECAAGTRRIFRQVAAHEGIGGQSANEIGIGEEIGEARLLVAVRGVDGDVKRDGARVRGLLAGRPDELLKVS